MGDILEAECAKQDLLRDPRGEAACKAGRQEKGSNEVTFARLRVRWA